MVGEEISTKNELIDSETQSSHPLPQTSNVIKEELIEIDQNDNSNLNISNKTKNVYDDQPIKCSLCEHTFMSHEILQDHIATIHKLPQTSIELIEIDYDQNDNSNPNDGIKTEENPESQLYKCDSCESHFESHEILQHHVDTIHKVLDEMIHRNECIECGAKFITENLLKKHLGSIHGQKQFSCQICKTAFCKEMEVKKHVRTVHEGKKLFECDICYKVDFVKLAPFIKHMKYIHQIYEIKGTIRCKKCSIYFTKQGHYKQHMKTVHGVKTMHICSICNKNFEMKGALEKHMATVHKGQKPFKCNLCDYASAFNSNLKNHYVKNHTESVHEGKFENKCSECVYSAETKTLLLKHIRKVHGVIMPYDCAYCDYRGATLEWLQKHCDLVHEGKNPTDPNGATVYNENNPVKKCSHCEKVFLKEDRLKEHIQLVHEGKNPYQCTICDVEFKYLQSLQGHMKSIHDGITYKCSICDMCFTQTGTLYHHMKVVHDKEKHFSCYECGSKFGSKSNLDIHFRRFHKDQLMKESNSTQLLESDYSCSKCGKSFPSRKELQQHGETVHDKKKPYKCPLCELRFYQNITLQKHISSAHLSKKDKNVKLTKEKKLHNGEKNENECPICKILCKTKKSLKHHLLSVHKGVNPYQCTKCEVRLTSALYLKNHMILVHKIENPQNFETETESFSTIEKEEDIIDKFECPICKTVYASKKNLKRHILSVHGVRPYQCTKCQTKFLSQRYLNQHMRKIHKIENMKNSRKTHSNNSNETEDLSTIEKRYIGCPFCKKNYADKASLKRHVLSVHEGVKHQCTKCDLKFGLKWSLNRHIKEVHQNIKRPVHEGMKPNQCTKPTKEKEIEDGCEIVFLDIKGQPAKESNLHNLLDSDHSCSKCGNSFTNREELKQHMETVHDRKKLSNGETKTKASDKIPISEEEKFECSFCKTLFATKQTLKRHVLSAHEGVKPYECTKCEAKFAFPSHLNAHMISFHESDRPYGCKICNSKFKVQQVLNAHMKRVHKIENQQNRTKKQNNVSNETENMSIIEKEDSVEYQLPYGWKKICHHRPRLHGRFMVLGNTRKSF